MDGRQAIRIDIRRVQNGLRPFVFAVKKVKQETEQHKVTIRNIRRTANDTAKKLKDNGTPEDEVKKLEADIQKMTDDFIKEIDKITELKEKELTEI